MRLIGKRRLAAVAASAALAGLGIAGPAVSASASTPVLYAGAGQEAHKCTVIGTDRLGNQGVVCADLIADETIFGPEFYGQVEVICQHSQNGVVQEVQCAEAHAYGALVNAQTGFDQRYEFDCGHSYGPCAANNQRNIWTIPGGQPGNGDNCQASLADNYWTVAFGQGNLTSIELPGSDQWVYLDSPAANDSGNQSTGHYQICP
jgi:hypothetical protein